MEEDETFHNFINARDKDGHTPLMLASWENHYTLIELLVKAGADVNVTDKDGDTAITLLMMKINSNKSKPAQIPSHSVEIKRVHTLAERHKMYSLVTFELLDLHGNLQFAC